LALAAVEEAEEEQGDDFNDLTQLETTFFQHENDFDTFRGNLLQHIRKKSH
jgi:chemotaxis methyl-accepting protein methylase